MRVEYLISSLPVLYILGAIGAFFSVLLIGLIPTPPEPIAASGWAAAALRSLLVLPMPLALALYLGGSWRSANFWGIALLAGSLMLLTTPLVISALIALCVYLLLKTTLHSTSVEQPQLSRMTMLIWIFCIVFFTTILRFSVSDEPFDRDLMVYAMVARSWLEGMPLYSQAWDHKPPALYAVYALAIAVFGQSPNAILALGIFAFVVTMLGIRSAAERLAGPWAGFAAVLFWAVFGNDVILQAQQPNVEVFMNACLIWALAFLLPVAKNQEQYGKLLASGALFFAASAFKQIAIFPAFFVALWLIWLSFSAKDVAIPMRFRRAVLAVSFFALPGVVGWLLIFLGFYVSGNFEEFWYGAFGYNQSYAGSILFNFAKTALRDVTHPYYVSTFFLLILMSWMLGSLKLRILMMATYVGNAVMVVAPGNNFPHYYQLILPVMAVGCGAHIARIIPSKKILGAVLIALAPIWISFGYFTSSERLSFVKYGERGHGGQSFESRQIGRWLAQHTQPNELVFHWGAEPGVYFWSGRATQYRFSYNYPLFIGPRSAEFSEEVLNEISCNLPDVVVINVNLTGGNHPISVFLEANYVAHPDAPSFDFFEIWTPKTGQSDCR